MVFVVVYFCFPLHSFWLMLLMNDLLFVTLFSPTHICSSHSATFPLLLNSFSVQVCLCKCVCACACPCSSTCEDPRGECEWHAADTQQEYSAHFLSASLQNKATRQERRGEEIICLSVRLPVRSGETEIAIITWSAVGTH